MYEQKVTVYTTGEVRMIILIRHCALAQWSDQVPLDMGPLPALGSSPDVL